MSNLSPILILFLILVFVRINNADPSDPASQSDPNNIVHEWVQRWNAANDTAEFYDITREVRPMFDRLKIAASRDAKAEQALQKLAQLKPIVAREELLLPGLAKSAIESLQTERDIRILLADATSPQDVLTRIKEELNRHTEWETNEPVPELAKMLLIRALEIDPKWAIEQMIWLQIVNGSIAEKYSKEVYEVAFKVDGTTLVPGSRLPDYLVWSKHNGANVVFTRWLAEAGTDGTDEGRERIFKIVSAFSQLPGATEKLTPFLESKDPRVVTAAAMRLWSIAPTADNLQKMKAAKASLQRSGVAAAEMEQLDSVVAGLDIELHQSAKTESKGPR